VHVTLLRTVQVCDREPGVLRQRVGVSATSLGEEGDDPITVDVPVEVPVAENEILGVLSALEAEVERVSNLE
jgi:hypothetical protein